MYVHLQAKNSEGFYQVQAFRYFKDPIRVDITDMYGNTKTLQVGEGEDQLEIDLYDDNDHLKTVVLKRDDG